MKPWTSFNNWNSAKSWTQTWGVYNKKCRSWTRDVLARADSARSLKNFLCLFHITAKKGKFNPNTRFICFLKRNKCKDIFFNSLQILSAVKKKVYHVFGDLLSHMLYNMWFIPHKKRHSCFHKKKHIYNFLFGCKLILFAKSAKEYLALLKIGKGRTCAGRVGSTRTSSSNSKTNCSGPQVSHWFQFLKYNIYIYII